jgi:hypothetical protein
MAAKNEESVTKKMDQLTNALKEHTKENSEIAEALELMKQTQTVRNLPLSVLDRFSYISFE